jgi:hypothetical protein
MQQAGRFAVWPSFDSIRTSAGRRGRVKNLRDKLRVMDARSRGLLKAFCLMLVPVVIALPALAFANFGPCGPTTGWSLTLLSLISFYCELRAFNIFQNSFSSMENRLRLIRFPLGFICISILLVDVALFFLMALPALVFGDLPNVFAKLYH